MATMDDWLVAVCRALELEPAEVRQDLVLDLARDVAHQVARPAAPVTAYLIGLAAGRGADLEQAARTVTDLARTWPGPTP